MMVFVWICGALLVAATAFTLVRLAQGPTLLDRVIASDVLLSVVAAAVVVQMVFRHRFEHVTLLLVFSLVGFLGSVTVARFARNAPDPEAPEEGQRQGEGLAATDGRAAAEQEDRS